MGFKSRPATSERLFTDATVQFLIDLQQNNDRDWFQANKQRYEDHVREPALAFIRAMAPHVTRVSKHFDASDKKVGGSLMRVFRDTRFSRDKTPYKTNIGIQFRHQAGKDAHAPGMYVHIAFDGCFVGAGSWRPEAESLGAIRRRIVERPAEWLAARDDKTFRKYFELGGESLVRMPRGFSEDDPNATDIRRKDFIAVTDMTLDDVLTGDLVAFCAERFSAAAPYLRFLTRAVNAPF